MHFTLFTGGLVLFCVGLSCCGTCFDASSVLEVDSHMEHYVFRTVKSPSVYSCASECLMSSVCLSFNFETRTRTCGLNSNSSDHVAITSQPGFLYSDISYWPKSLAGACSETSCPTSRCQLDRLGRASCETVAEFQGCDAPPTVANAAMHYDGVYEGAVAVYTCSDNFLMCSAEHSRVCQSTGNWDGFVGPCAQYIWDNPNIDFALDLPCGDSKSFKVALHVTPTAKKKVHMDFLSGPNILCHIDFRLDDNTVVFGSRFAGVWGSGTTITPVPMTVGTESLVEIRLDKGMYMITVDGKSIRNVTDEYPGEIIEDFYVSGDGLVSAANITLGALSSAGPGQQPHDLCAKRDTK
ncbi:uncharacterized protein LOC124262386 [Haliotis rubra]|uniref:uncharacterized protein LOC124262386 n=1 Tax=Haliotis rubra TaxID=36100 RepID=UPI001EE53691|nr:uncharacterized protein LOC124262386 [Haliotis rubra]